MAHIYGQKDNGDLHVIGEVEVDDDMKPDLLIDLLLDEETKLRTREFVVFLPSGVFRVTVNGDDPVNPRRDISVAPMAGGDLSSATEDDDEEEAPAPKRTRKAPAKRGTSTKKTTAKRSTAKRSSGNKLAGSKKGGTTRKSPLRKNARSAE